MDWRKGGWSGSLDIQARRNASAQARAHPKLHLVRYGAAEHLMRGLFSIRTFGGFIGLYLLINLLFGALEVFSVHLAPSWLPEPGSSDPEVAVELEGLMLNVSSYLLGAQIGLLGVISLSLTLVTLIAQREGSSTDIQLYYHESLALELVASCVALAVVLCLQFVWPLQMLLYHVGLGAGMQVFKLTLFSLHLFWLLVNLSVAAYFIIITFQFVQQSARERFRNRYTAYVVLPRDLRRALREQLYLDAGQAAGHSPAFVFGQVGEGVPELFHHFPHPAALSDVHMRGVNWVTRRWLARSLRQQGASSQKGAPCLFFSPRMDEPFNGPLAWCHRRGGVALSRLERLVLRCSFRFQRVRAHQADPSPAHILEGLIENTIAQVDRQTPVAFDSALGELLRYHQFVLGLSVARGAAGQPFSFTTMPGFGWHPPHRPWSGQYRRLFRRAAEYLGEDAHFFHVLSQTPSRLLPRHGEVPLPADVTRELFRLGPLLTRALENWVEHRAAADDAREKAGALCLLGLDAMIHHETVPVMVSAWEQTLRDTPHLHAWPAATRQEASHQWQAYRESFGFLFQHLCETAHSLAIAVRHGDATAASEFAAALKRWPQQVLINEVRADVNRCNPWLHPALIEMEWAGIQQVNPEAGEVGPSSVFASVLQNAHADIMLMTAGLLLSHMPETEAGKLSARISSQLLPVSGTQAFAVVLAAFLRLSTQKADPSGHNYRQELKRAFQTLETALSHTTRQDPALIAGDGGSRPEPIGERLALLLVMMQEQEKYVRHAVDLPESGVLQAMGLMRLLTVLDDPPPRLETGLRRLHREENPKELCARLKEIVARAGGHDENRV